MRNKISKKSLKFSVNADGFISRGHFFCYKNVKAQRQGKESLFL